MEWLTGASCPECLKNAPRSAGVRRGGPQPSRQNRRFTEGGLQHSLPSPYPLGNASLGRAAPPAVNVMDENTGEITGRGEGARKQSSPGCQRVCDFLGSLTGDICGCRCVCCDPGTLLLVHTPVPSRGVSVHPPEDRHENAQGHPGEVCLFRSFLSLTSSATKSFYA